VHFALAFAVAGALAESMGILARRERLERFGGALLLPGTAALVLAVATGYLAANTAPNVAGALTGALAAHERFALAGAGSLIVLVVWKALGRGRIPDRHRALYAVALLTAAALLAWAALLGGRLVYDHAVGVTVPD
jgi:uncharacterized membrane protein